jgi:hypothetical protein
MLHTLQSYNGKKIKATPEVEQDLVHLLRILATRESDHYKVNLRTFHANELKPRGLDIPVRRIQVAFEALDAAGVCKLRKGSMNRLEKAEFTEPARIVARKLLGIQKVLDVFHEASAHRPGGDLDTAKEILLAEMPDATKIKILKSLLLKE